MNATVYARWSPRPNPEDCDSAEKQIERVTLYCKAHDYTIVGMFSDRDKSGADTNRPELHKAIACAKKNKGLLVTYDLSRLSRNTVDALTISQDMNKCGCGIATVVDQIDTSTPMGRCFFTIRVAFDTAQRELIVDRTSKAMQHHQSNGRIMGSKAPYGWKIDENGPKNEKSGRPSRMVQCPEEQAMIREIVGAAMSGHGLRVIARSMTENGHLCRGRPWSHKAVASIIKRAKT